MIVTLPTQLETWVSSQVQAGVYADTNEVLVEALELLKMQVALEEQVAFLSQASAEPLCVNWCSKVNYLKICPKSHRYICTQNTLTTDSLCSRTKLSTNHSSFN